jgi:hypothetical protein
VASPVKSGRNTFRVAPASSRRRTAGRNCAWLTKGYSLRPAVSSRKRFPQQVIAGWGGNASRVEKQSSGNLPSVGAVVGAARSNQASFRVLQRQGLVRGKSDRLLDNGEYFRLLYQRQTREVASSILHEHEFAKIFPVSIEKQGYSEKFFANLNW